MRPQKPNELEKALSRKICYLKHLTSSFDNSKWIVFCHDKKSLKKSSVSHGKLFKACDLF